MRRSIVPALALVALTLQAPVATAQLPQITVPRGMLRIELGGAFYPTDNIWDHGTHEPLGSLLTAAPLDAAATPLAAQLNADIATVLGHAGSGVSLGNVSTIAEQQHGVGNIGLGWALTRRISLFANAPIVYLRSRVTIRYDSTGANVGINPADPIIGTLSGRSATTTFFTQLDAAIDTLGVRLAAGAYSGDPTQQALAQQTLANAPAIRNALYRMLADTAGAIAVVPTAGSADGTALLAAVATLRSTFTTGLGITGFTADPALPQDTLTTPRFNNVLTSPTGFGLGAPDATPHWTLGDVSAGITALLVQHDSSVDRGFSLWGQASMRFPTAATVDATVPFAQAAGAPGAAVDLAAIAEGRRGRLGVRTALRYELQLQYDVQERIAPPGALLVPASLDAAVRRRPGAIFSYEAWPYFRFAPHLAVSGTFEYWRKGADRTAYLPGQAMVGGLPATVVDVGTAANAVVLGIGLSYSHDGRTLDGKVGIPVEAGFSIERTVTSSAGLFPAPLTTRMYFRVYKPIFKP